LRSELEKVSREFSKKGGIYTEYLKVNKTDLLDVLYTIAVKNKKNSFIEYIRRTEWDGIKRTPTFLYESGYRTSGLTEKQEQTYLESVFIAFLLSIIERNLNPDYVSIPFIPVLIGEQGSGKSSLLSALGFGKLFYKQTTTTFESEKKFFESIQGATIVELLEATQLEKGNPEQSKAFFDATDYSYRKSYAAESSNRRVHYGMVVTTNNYLILSDQTGNRRYFPLYLSKDTVSIMPHQRNVEEIQQIWAEALELYNSGARWRDYLYRKDDPNELKPIFTKMQDNATDTVGAPDLIKGILDSQYPNIGDVVNHYELKDQLRNEGEFYGHDLNDALKIFMKSPTAFGFSKPVQTTKYFPGKGSRYVKEYHRIKKPLGLEVSVTDVELVV